MTWRFFQAYLQEGALLESLSFDHVSITMQKNNEWLKYGNSSQLVNSTGKTICHNTPVTRVGQGKQLRSTIRNQTLDLGISLYNATREAGMAQWWKHLHPTTVRPRFDSWIWPHIWVEFVVGSPPFPKLTSRRQGRSWAFFATSLSLLTV